MWPSELNKEKLTWYQQLKLVLHCVTCSSFLLAGQMLRFCANSVIEGGPITSPVNGMSFLRHDTLSSEGSGGVMPHFKTALNFYHDLG